MLTRRAFAKTRLLFPISKRFGAQAAWVDNSSSFVGESHYGFDAEPVNTPQNSSSHVGKCPFGFDAKPVNTSTTSRCPVTQTYEAVSNFVSSSLYSFTRRFGAKEVDESVATTPEGLKAFEEIPGPKSIPVLGSSAGDFMNKCYVTGEKIKPVEMYTVGDNGYYGYGTICKYGHPGVGLGKNSEMLMICDPRDAEDLMTIKDPYPVGGIQFHWPFIDFVTRAGYHVKDLWTQGESWKRVRNEVQKKLTSPKDAREYIPNIVAAAKLAVEGAEKTENPHEYLIASSFDMICSVTLGRLTQTANKTEGYNPKFTEFQKVTHSGLQELVPMMQSPWENVMKLGLGVTTKRNLAFGDTMQKSFNLIESFIDELRDSAKNGTLNDLEKNCWAVKAYERSDKDTALSQKGYSEIISLLLAAGIDTTSTVFLWNLIHLAGNPEVQEKLRQELVNALGEEGCITTKTQFKKEFPYLLACIRETHRINPVIMAASIKDTQGDREVNGFHIPKGTRFMFNLRSIQNDPKYVENPEQYRPERWLDDEVEARKGTEAEVIDHRLLANAFSSGPRMCPGMRVANLEIYIYLSELLRKFEITMEPNPEYKCYQYLTILPEPLPKLYFRRRN